MATSWGGGGGIVTGGQGLHHLHLLGANKGGTLVASTYQASAKGDEATHSPRSRETNRSRKLLAPLKRTSVILISRMVSREKGTTNKSYTTKKWVRSGVGGRPKERDYGLKTQPLGTVTSLQPHCPTLYYTKQPRDPSIRMQRALQRFKI